MPSDALTRWLRLVRPHDFVWLILFALLVSTITPYSDFPAVAPLLSLAVVQVLEPKIAALATVRGRVLWIVLKLVLGYLLIGYTGGVVSGYWPVLLLPVVSAATVLGVFNTLLFTGVTAAAYLTFLGWVDGPERALWVPSVLVRVATLGIVGNLANMLAEDLRVQSRKYRRAAEQLGEVNRQLQAAEEAVRRSDRLAALGQLSAGLAHELRNPLGTIKASAEMLNRSVAAENDVAREMAGFISSEADRTNSLITRFLQFARPLQLRLEPADLARALDRAVEMVEREAPGVAIYKNYELGMPPFPFDSELMERVFYNLMLNAVQASPKDGTVTVKTRPSGRMAEIAVIDRGSGIERKHREAIFNPFFTTKPEGVGLGLAIVSKIVDEHGGKIAVESEPGKGSIFRVFLPMTR